MTDTAIWQNRITGQGAAAPAQLLANPRNWRIHPKAQQDALSGLLDRVGWVQNVIVNQRTGHVIDGHLRVSLAISRGEPEIPVVYVDLAEDEEALVLASLDPLAAMAVTDEELLANLLGGLEAEGALADMLDNLLPRPKTGLTDPDAVPPTPAAPVTRPGDLWLLGEHRLLCGDATKAADMSALMAGNLAACLWTDPPYGVAYVGKTADALTLQNDEEAGMAGLLAAAWAVAAPALEGGAPFYVARPAGALSITFGSAIIEAGWGFHEELVWIKDSMVLGHSDYHYQHETIIYGWLPGEGRSGRGRHQGSRWYGDNSQTSVFHIDRPKASPDHPTGKPVDLVERCLLNSTRALECVLDPFLGSGTTLIAAERLDRRCYAMEIEPKYVDVAVKRWEEFTGQQAVLSG